MIEELSSQHNVGLSQVDIYRTIIKGHISISLVNFLYSSINSTSLILG